MKKIYLFVYFICWLFVMSAAPVVYGAGPELVISGQMGASFGTIDVKINLRNWEGEHPSIYYLALARDARYLIEKKEIPDAEMILAYVNGVTTEGLDTGRAVRGHWIASTLCAGHTGLSGASGFFGSSGSSGSSSTSSTSSTSGSSGSSNRNFNRTFSLLGGENVKRIPRETGFVDGFRYDIFMVVANSGSDYPSGYSNVAEVKDIMAMPFDGMVNNGMGNNGIFTIRAMDKGPRGRQLANIQRMADLYHETGGLLGTLDFLEADYVLTSDIDLWGYGNWKPMDFKGSFEGNGHCIRNLRIFEGNQEQKAYGLFGTLDGAAISNLQIDGAKISVDVPYPVGVLAGTVINSTLTDCGTSNCSVISQGTGSVGGFAGQGTNSIFANCHAFTDVEGNYYTGGFVGLLAEDAILYGCEAKGHVFGDRAVGGFVGWAFGKELSENANHSIKIIECHSYGPVEAEGGIAGGFAGSLAYTYVNASSNWGNTWSAGQEVGGFVGRLTHRSRITNACTQGDVTNVWGGQTGGFVGQITYGSGIEYSYSDGDVRGLWDIGGFAGAIAAPGAPNTLYGCISYARWISSDEVSACGVSADEVSADKVSADEVLADKNLPDDNKKDSIHRFAGRLDHLGVNDCYAYLGSVVATAEGLSHVSPNPYGPDGGDFNNQTIEKLLTRLGWNRKYWSYDWDEVDDVVGVDGMDDLVPLDNNDLKKPRLNIV